MYLFSKITVPLKITGTTEIMATAGIYHPPMSENNPNYSIFITVFGPYHKTLISQFKRWIIIGVITIHVNKPNDYITYNYMIMLDSVSLCQLMDFPIHQSGNTLDHILARSNETDKVEKLTRGNTLADHNWMLFQLSAFSSAQVKCLIEYSKLSGEAYSQVINEVEEIVEQAITSENLEQVFQYFDKIKTVCESKIRTTSKYIAERLLKTWFSSELKVFGRKTRGAERVIT